MIPITEVSSRQRANCPLHLPPSLGSAQIPRPRQHLHVAVILRDPRHRSRLLFRSNFSLSNSASDNATRAPQPALTVPQDVVPHQLLHYSATLKWRSSSVCEPLGSRFSQHPYRLFPRLARLTLFTILLAIHLPKLRYAVLLAETHQQECFRSHAIGAPPNSNFDSSGSKLSFGIPVTSSAPVVRLRECSLLATCDLCSFVGKSTSDPATYVSLWMLWTPLYSYRSMPLCHTILILFFYHLLESSGLHLQ